MVIDLNKLKPKNLKWKKHCKGLYGGFIDDIEVMQVVQCNGYPEWYFVFTRYTQLSSDHITRPLFKKQSSATKAAEKAYKNSFKATIEHLLKISNSNELPRKKKTKS